jgi:urease accessory protein
MVQTLPQIQQNWRGVAHLNYQVRVDKCVPVETFTQAPLKIQKPLYPEGPAVCHSTLVHTAGGMVGGDQLNIQVELAADCRTVLTTAAANKVYGSQPTQGQKQPLVASQTVNLSLASRSCLEWFPQETIVFNQAHFHQQIRVGLAPGALWCGWDVMRFGRSARGERFEAGEVRSRLAIWQDQHPLWIDNQRLVGGSAALDSLNGLAGNPVMGTFALVGMIPAADQISPLRELWNRDLPGDVGVTRLQNGLLCRYRGPSSQAARRWFVAVWQQLRPWYLNTTATVPRVWGR